MQKLNKSAARVRVVVADDNSQVREMVVHLLTPDFDVVGTAMDGSAACKMVLRLKPEIAVLDISMPVLTGIEAAAELKRKGSTSKTVFLTVHEDSDFIKAALGCGASGYVVKSQMATDLSTAIREAIAGNFFISPCCGLSDDLFGH